MSDEKKEKKEQLRSKVQALVTYYEEEKRRNEELEMEIERLRAAQHAGEFIPPAAPQASGFRMDTPAPQQPSYQMQHFAPPAPPAPQPAGYGYGGSYSNSYAPTPQMSCQRTLQGIDQLRTRLQQFAYDSYNSPCGDYETINMIERLQAQLGDLCRELSAPAPMPAPQPAYAPPMTHYPPPPPRYY